MKEEKITVEIRGSLITLEDSSETFMLLTREEALELVEKLPSAINKLPVKI